MSVSARVAQEVGVKLGHEVRCVLACWTDVLLNSVMRPANKLSAPGAKGSLFLGVLVCMRHCLQAVPRCAKQSWLITRPAAWHPLRRRLLASKAER